MSPSDSDNQRSSRHPVNQAKRPRFRFVPKHRAAGASPDALAPEETPRQSSPATAQAAAALGSPTSALKQSINRAVDQTVERAKNRAIQKVSDVTGLPTETVAALSRKPTGKSHGSERFAALTEPLKNASPQMAELRKYAQEINDSLDEPDPQAASDRRRAVARAVADKAPLHVNRTVYDSPISDVVEVLHAADVIELAVHAAIEAAIHVAKK